MNLTVDALKVIYVALGGSASEVENITLIPDMLEKISVYAKAAAAELPAVNAEDAGSVLMVNEEGKWAKGEAGGLTIIDFTPPTGGSKTVDFSSSDIYSRVLAGENIVFRNVDETHDTVDALYHIVSLSSSSIEAVSFVKNDGSGETDHGLIADVVDLDNNSLHYSSRILSGSLA